MMQMRKHEERAIQRFCERLSSIEGSEVRVVRWPECESPGQGTCDAILSRGGLEHALEHTTIDSFRDQRLDDDKMRKVVAPVGQALTEAFPDLALTLEVEFGCVQPGPNWPALTKTLVAKCTEVIPSMPFGASAISFEFDGVGFPVRLSRLRASETQGCQILRRIPVDRRPELVQIVKDAINRKREKLPHYAEGRPTILLLDSDDFQSINPNQVAEAFAAAQVSCEGLDEVYFIRTYSDPIWIYPLKVRDRTYPGLADFQRFLDKQYELSYGPQT